jgi:hypothetical protein
MEIKAILPENLGWLESKLDESILKRVRQAIKKASIDHGKSLAGNISSSLVLEDKDNWFFKEVIVPHIKTFEKAFPAYTHKDVYGAKMTQSHSIAVMDQWWVNFQKQYEFNPVHNHGGIFSFVIWLEIPTHYKDQHKLPISGGSNHPSASNFEFHFVNNLGYRTHHIYKLSPASEGTMLFFPARLEHCVYPFYNCKKNRVSVAGNIYLDSLRLGNS